jgi:hypothetical protein
MAGKRISAAEMALRVDEVFNLLLQGLGRRQVLRFVADQRSGGISRQGEPLPDWQVRNRQVDNYLAKATERLKESGKTQRDIEMGRAVARLNDLYAKSAARSDLRTCLSVQKDLTELLGLAAPNQLEIMGKDGGMIDVVQHYAEKFDSLIAQQVANLAKAPDVEPDDH